MTASARSTRKPRVVLPTLDDVGTGKLSLDEYERAHGEDIPELTAEVMAQAKHLSDFPELAKLFRPRGQQKAPVKERIGLRLDKAIVEHFRSTGPGWQSRINDILAAHVKANDNS